ncbi:MAG: hypothetical protein HZT41_05750 [Dechloromonas sp.]|nr:MAG: hypothetical protein HZT41_05750 [Dechloromonas sp.]
MKLRSFRWFNGFMESGWLTFLLFCLLAPLSHHLVFAPLDIRGKTDYRKFQIAVQDTSVPTRIAFCTFEPGPPRNIDLKLNCSTTEGAIPITQGSLLMNLPAGQVPLLKDEPDYGWTRYTLLSDDGHSQWIETETYYNSDSLVTRYRVTGNRVEPVGQIFATRGLNQMFVFFLPILLLFARLLASMLRAIARKVLAPRETGMSAGT